MKEVDHDMIWDRTSEQCIMSPVHDIPQHQNLLSFAIAKKKQTIHLGMLHVLCTIEHFPLVPHIMCT